MGFKDTMKKIFGGSTNLNVDTTNVVSVDDIYAAAGLTDKEKSIYKVEEIKKALPDILPTDTKKELTISMMGITKLTIDDASSDADSRINSLTEALDEFSAETENIKNAGKEQISKLEDQVKVIEVQIDAEKQKIVERSKLQEDQQDVIRSEISKVNKIKDFIKA